MRLFAALEPTSAWRDALSAAQDQLRATGVRARYLERANFHMTLAFIGEWNEDVTAVLPEVREPFSITLGHFGAFREAAVLWAGIRSSAELDALAALVRQRLTESGIPFDGSRGFAPHLTLARKPVIPEGLRLDRIELPAVSMTVREVCLYESRREGDAMKYTVIGRR